MSEMFAPPLSFFGPHEEFAPHTEFLNNFTTDFSPELDHAHSQIRSVTGGAGLEATNYRSTTKRLVGNRTTTAHIEVDHLPLGIATMEDLNTMKPVFAIRPSDTQAAAAAAAAAAGHAAVPAKPRTHHSIEHKLGTYLTDLARVNELLLRFAYAPWHSLDIGYFSNPLDYTAAQIAEVFEFAGFVGDIHKLRDEGRFPDCYKQTVGSAFGKCTVFTQGQVHTHDIFTPIPDPTGGSQQSHTGTRLCFIVRWNQRPANINLSWKQNPDEVHIEHQIKTSAKRTRHEAAAAAKPRVIPRSITSREIHDHASVVRTGGKREIRIQAQARAHGIRDLNYGYWSFEARSYNSTFRLEHYLGTLHRDTGKKPFPIHIGVQNQVNRVTQHPNLTKFVAAYCDVTATQIAEVFTANPRNSSNAFKPKDSQGAFNSIKNYIDIAVDINYASNM